MTKTIMVFVTQILLFTLCLCSPAGSIGEAAFPEVDADAGQGDSSELLQKKVKVNGLLPEAIDTAGVGKVQSDAAAAAGGSPEETVNEYCDAQGVARMHGYVGKNGSMIRGDQEVLMSDIMDDVANELTDNSIDQMVKDIFSFYICVRWVPDEEFWSVAEQELAAEILQSVVEKSESTTQAIGELYQNFKFAPLLCTQNLKVYGETSDVDHTYFTVFKETVANLSATLSHLASGPVWNKLKQADELFCGGDKMNSVNCDVQMGLRDFANRATAWLGDWGTNFDTKEDKWKLMQDIFKQFAYHTADTSWNTDFANWKKKFPYHSFIAKPGGVDVAHSPTSSQRFLICFGKRVASELHRRPRGDHIITDQNNVGCHGWWDAQFVSDMLERTVDLWKPPTCDLAEMYYDMKKQILQMFQRMNEQLFEALPNMLSDEELKKNGKLDESIQGPPVFNVAAVSVGSAQYFDGTRVAATKEIVYDGPGRRRRWCMWDCESKIAKGHAGTVTVEQNSNGPNVPVKWDGHGQTKAMSTSVFKTMPHEYGVPVDGILDTIQGWATSAYKSIDDFFGTFWGGQYTSLAAMMSGSVAKWVVCPIAPNISLEELDKNLGTEDVVFREFVKEAYAKWTGYEAKLPGEQCAKEDEFLDPSLFPGCQICETSELHVDFPERYFLENGEKDDFMCPVKSPLEPAEQLSIFKEKKNMCMLHMTDKQNRQHQWHYQGHHPARKQYNVQANVPLPEFELIKLLDIDTKPGLKQIAYGRTCTVEEQNANPRFCGLNELENPWDDILDMANAVTGFLQGAVGLPVGAVTGLISNVQEVIKNAKESPGDAATFIGEQAWNALMGIGRLAHDTTHAVANEVVYNLPASDKRHARLEAELYGFKHGGDFVHSTSYQKGIGANNRSSNARQRYRRYAVVCPCNSFDPGMELALKWRWTEVVLRVMREGLKHNNALLDKPTAFVKFRAEAKLFFRDNVQAEENNTWFEYDAAMDAGSVEVPAPSCKKKGSRWSGYYCQPTDSCTLVGNWWSKQCVAKATPPTGPWRVVWDKKLASEVRGTPIGQTDVAKLSALTVTLYCGRKKDFGATGGPSAQSASLKQCMESGVLTNAQMKSEKPWKVYLPDEVIVVAVFGTMESSECLSLQGSTETHVCSGATKKDSLDSHLSNTDKASAGGVYHGMRTGSGYPKGTLKEVVLRPEDILEVNGLLF